MGVALTNTQLVYETGQMVIFILLAKGWSITRENFSANEWRGVIMMMSGFYMANSTILVLQASVLSVNSFLLAVGILYGLVYLYILVSGVKNIISLRHQVSYLT
jgi:Rhodopsin-like GPCR transmembrane domain